jgi:hypothetical protein
MKSVLETALDSVVGALDIDRAADGMLFHRTPATAREQLNDAFLNYHSSVTSGVRIEAFTDCSMLEIDVELQHMVLPSRPSNGSTFDLVIAGDLREPLCTSNERLILLDAATRRFTPGPANPVTLRFELGAATDARRI